MNQVSLGLHDILSIFADLNKNDGLDGVDSSSDF